MSNNAKKSQGTILQIGTTAANEALDSFEDVGEAKMIGEFGPESSTIETTALADLAKTHIKGTPDGGTIEVTGNAHQEDSGQAAMLSAAEDNGDDPYNFRVVLSDKITGGGAGTTYKFKALVIKYKVGAIGVDQVIPFAASLKVTGPITKAAAT